MVITAFKNRQEYLNSQFAAALAPDAAGPQEAIARGICCTGCSTASSLRRSPCSPPRPPPCRLCSGEMQFPGRDTTERDGVPHGSTAGGARCPAFLLMVHVGLINTLPSVIVVYVGLTIPLSVYLLTNFFQALPYEIEEAARIDGCSH